MKNRKKMIMKASMISAIAFVLQGILTIIRTGMIVKIYGSNVNGVISLAQQIFNYLVLLESGLGAAYLYKMYKPMAEKNLKKVKSLYLGLTKSLKKIAIIMFFVMVFISIIYPSVMNKDSLSYLSITFILILLGIRFILPYYFTINQKNLLYIYEEKYIVDFIDGLSSSVILLLEIILMKYVNLNIMLVLCIGIIGIIIVNYIYYMILKKRCGDILKEDAQPSFEGNSMTKDILIHQVSSVIFSSTDNILLSIFSTLNNVTIYSAYNTILTYPVSLFNKIIDNLRATFGKKMVENEEKTIELFYETFSLSVFSSMIMAPMFYVLINKFIFLWIGKDFILNNYCVAIWTLLFIHRILIPTVYVLRDSKGLYKESKYYTLIQAITNLIISLILIKPFGILGLLLGTVISTYVILIPANYLLISKKILKNKFQIFFNLFTAIIFCFIAILGLNIFNNFIFNNFENNWFNFIKMTMIDGCIVSVLSFVFLYLINKNFRNLIKRFLPNK